MSNRNFIKDVLLGVAVGDALGVPVEFKSRSFLQQKPVTGMIGHGSHHQPAGTWSDDSSMTFCLAEMLCEKYNLQNLAHRFINWKNHNYWTPRGDVFDIGITTRWAIDSLDNGVNPVLAGGNGEDNNGNGSLMRILPLLFFIQHKPIDQRFLFVKDVSSLTHRHIRSVLSCFIYLEFALEILKGNNQHAAYRNICNEIKVFLNGTDVCSGAEFSIFERILSGGIHLLPEGDIQSSGYVLHTLEASLWCILVTTNFEHAVLKAVNLGNDTDTTGAVTGGLAGLLYGWDTIPADWLNVLARKNDIVDLAKRLTNKNY